MSASTVPPASDPLVGITVRRSIVAGRAYLIYGAVVGVILGVSLSLSSGTAFGAAFPLFLPVFAAIGSLGSLMVFTSDRMKGVLEYLLAYGISPRRLFVDVLLAAVVLVTIVAAVDVSVALSIYFARGGSLDTTTTLAIAAYGVPMSYASAAFAATTGMYWTALSSPRSGMHSPGGFAPLLGILPPLAVVAVVGVLGGFGASGTTLDLVAFAGVSVVAVVVILLVSLVGRLMARERLLSPL